MVESYTTVANETTTFLTGLLIAGAVAALVIYIILAISWQKLFVKKGEIGYKAWIPIYNSYILMKIIGMNPWMVLLYFIPIVNIFVLALLSVRVANTYEKGAGFALGILFLPFVCYPILAFGNPEKTIKEKTKTVEPEENIVLCPNCDTKLAIDAASCFVCGEPIIQKKSIEAETLTLTEETVLPVPSFLSETPVFNNEEITEENPLIEPFSKEEIDTLEEKNDPVMIQDGVLHFTPEENFSISENMSQETPSFDFEKIVSEYNMTTNMEEITEEKPKLEDMLKVENTYDNEEREDSIKYRSSSKTLDEILKINSDLYAGMEAKKTLQDSFDEPYVSLEEASLKEERLPFNIIEALEQAIPLSGNDIEENKEPFPWEDQKIETLASEEYEMSMEKIVKEDKNEDDSIPFVEKSIKYEDEENIEVPMEKEEIPEKEKKSIEMPIQEDKNEDDSIPFVEESIKYEDEENMEVSTEKEEIPEKEEKFIEIPIQENKNEEDSIPFVEESIKYEDEENEIAEESSWEEIHAPKVFVGDKLPDDTLEEELPSQEKISLDSEVKDFMKDLKSIYLEKSNEKEQEELKKISPLSMDDFKPTLNHDPIEERSAQIHDPEAADLLNKINEVNAHVEKKPKKEEKPTFGQVKQCGNCGSTIPRYSTRCLLCGAEVEEGEKITV